tara:strand:+ start:39944 stop:40756 length:813 start_codon:yes stop_codon:yes gene_type:complete
MKIRILVLFTFLTLVASCSDKAEIVSIYNQADDTGYVEYLWCKNGPDFSQESFSAMLSEWNQILDGLETTVTMSVGLVPRTPTDLYDGIWVLVWDSKAQSEKGWKEWLDGPAESWTENTSSILACGASDNGEVLNYGFDVSSFRSATAADSEPGGVAGFAFCSYTDSFGPKELLENIATYNSWLGSAEEAAGTGSPYFYTIHEPDFETPIPGTSVGSYDYAFHHFWDSEESRLQGAALFAQTAPAPQGPQPDCIEEMILFDTYPFRAPQM